MTTITEPKRLESLAFGNRIRLDQAALRREIAALPRHEGYAYVAQLLREPNDLVGRMTTLALLTSIRRVGRSTCLRLLRDTDITAAHLERRVAITSGRHRGRTPLSDRMRLVLAEVLEQKANGASS